MFFGGDPFEHFAGMHGGGGSRRGGMGGPRADVDTTKLYETLGVSFRSWCCSLMSWRLALAILRAGSVKQYNLCDIFNKKSMLVFLPQVFEMIYHLSVCRPSRIDQWRVPFKQNYCTWSKLGLDFVHVHNRYMMVTNTKGRHTLTLIIDCLLFRWTKMRTIKKSRRPTVNLLSSTILIKVCHMLPNISVLSSSSFQQEYFILFRKSSPTKIFCIQTRWWWTQIQRNFCRLWSSLW